MKRKMLISAALVLSVCAWLAHAAGGGADDKSAPPVIDASAMTVTVAKPADDALAEYLELTGAVIPRSEIVVSTEIDNARVIELLVEEGETVKAGQVLARLDSERMRFQLEQAEAQMKRNEDQLNRIQRIKQAVSNQELAEKQLDLQAAKAQYDELKLQLQRAVICAPAPGILYEKNIQLGSLARTGEILFRIAGEAKTEIEVQVPESRLPRLQIGQTGELQVSGFEQPFNGSVRRIYPQIDARQRTAKVRVALASDHFLPIGAFAHLKLEIDSHRGVVLPLSAIQQDEAGNFIWVVQDEKAVRKSVDLLFRNEGRAVVSGDIVGADVIIRAGSLLREGESVRVAENIL